MKKAITELSDEEIIKLAHQSSETKIEHSNDIMEFVSVYNLKTGEERITTKLLYNLYSKWSQNPVTRKTFALVLIDLFPSIRYGKSHVICLDKKAINLKEETYNYLKRMDKTKQKNWTIHFKKYLSKYQLKKGGLFIKDTVLYNLYDKWCFKGYKTKNYHPLSLYQFNNFCKLFFKNKLVKGNYWFGLEYTILNHLSEDLIKEMKK